MKKNANEKHADSAGRVIGFDSHPDSFTAALLQGPTPAAAVLEKMFNQVPMSQLQNWAQKHTLPQDLFVLEASGNSFQVVRLLAGIERQALVLESCQLGKLKEAHANNDKISAVRIGKATETIVDKGTFSPGTTITHDFAQNGLFSAASEIEVEQVTFADGTSWQRA